MRKGIAQDTLEESQGRSMAKPGQAAVKREYLVTGLLKAAGKVDGVESGYHKARALFAKAPPRYVTMTVVDGVDGVDVDRECVWPGQSGRTKGAEGETAKGKKATRAHLQWGLSIAESMPRTWSAMLVIVSSSRLSV